MAEARHDAVVVGSNGQQGPEVPQEYNRIILYGQDKCGNRDSLPTRWAAAMPIYRGCPSPEGRPTELVPVARHIKVEC